MSPHLENLIAEPRIQYAWKIFLAGNFYRSIIVGFVSRTALFTQAKPEICYSYAPVQA